MDRVTRILYRELYRRSFHDFVKDFWHTCDPSKFIDGQLIEYYCEVFEYFCRFWTNEKLAEKIENFEYDKEHDTIVDIRQGDKHNLCINMPPRHTKTMVFDVMGPVWLWLSNPIKAISISHTNGLSTEVNSKRHKLVNSKEFKELWGDDIQLTANSVGYLNDIRGGELRALNRNNLTGYGGDIIINDDLTNAEAARKDKAEMMNAWEYYKNTMPSRINDISKCIIMNIQQRLAPNDITGHIQSDAELSSTYVFIVIPAYFEQTTHYIGPMSGKVYTWKKGEYLWSERFGDYQSLKQQVGRTVWETQYLQKPIASDKTVIKDNMIIIKGLNEVPSIDDADMIYASHDFPVKDKDSSDFLGSVLSYRVGSTLYIKDCLEAHMAFVKSVEYVETLDSTYMGIIQIIEDKANGSPILQQLQDKIAGLQAYQPGSNSKTQRLESASLYMISGNVIFVASKFNTLTQTYELTPTLQNLVDRLIKFPFVEHDDITDAFSQNVLYVFMDKKYMVYGRAFNNDNVVNTSTIACDYSTIFFNKEGDMWKVLEIGVKYGIDTKLYALREQEFKASTEDGLKMLNSFASNKSVAIDCSKTDAMYGISNNTIAIEKYSIDDFDKSVAQMNLIFSRKQMLLDRHCKLCKNDIESFKFAKTKDDNVKYITDKDGFVACMRVALKYYGIN